MLLLLLFFKIKILSSIFASLGVLLMPHFHCDSICRRVDLWAKNFFANYTNPSSYMTMKPLLVLFGWSISSVECLILLAEICQFGPMNAKG